MALTLNTPNALFQRLLAGLMLLLVSVSAATFVILQVVPFSLPLTATFVATVASLAGLLWRYAGTSASTAFSLLTIAILGIVAHFQIDSSIPIQFALAGACLMSLAISALFVSLAVSRWRSVARLAPIVVYNRQSEAGPVNNPRVIAARKLLALCQRANSPFGILKTSWDYSQTSIPVVPLHKVSVEQDLQRYFEHHKILLLLEETVRESDIVLPEGMGNHAYVLCPLTDAEGLRGLARRLTKILAKHRCRLTSLSCSVFPADGYRIEELLHAADSTSRKFTIGEVDMSFHDTVKDVSAKTSGDATGEDISGGTVRASWPS